MSKEKSKALFNGISSDNKKATDAAFKKVMADKLIMALEAKKIAVATKIYSKEK